MLQDLTSTLSEDRPGLLPANKYAGSEHCVRASSLSYLSSLRCDPSVQLCTVDSKGSLERATAAGHSSTYELPQRIENVVFDDSGRCSCTP